MDLPIVEFDYRGKIPHKWLCTLIDYDIAFLEIHAERQVWINEKDAVDWLNPGNLKNHKIYGMVLLYVKRVLFKITGEEINTWRFEYKFYYRFSPTKETKYIIGVQNVRDAK